MGTRTVLFVCVVLFGAEAEARLVSDVSIFTLKEVQLQRDPGYRNSSYPESGGSPETTSSVCMALLEELVFLTSQLHLPQIQETLQRSIVLCQNREKQK